MNIRYITGVIIGITLLTTFGATILKQSVDAQNIGLNFARSEPKAPMVASGDNLYIVWWTNK